MNLQKRWGVYSVDVCVLCLCFCESVWTVYSVAVQLGSELLLVGKILMLPMSPYVPSLLWFLARVDVG